MLVFIFSLQLRSCYSPIVNKYLTLVFLRYEYSDNTNLINKFLIIPSGNIDLQLIKINEMLSITITAGEVKDRLEYLKLLPDAPVKFPKMLRNQHLITANTQVNFDKDYRYNDSKKPIYISYNGNKIFLNRVLLMTDYLVKFLEFRGYRFDRDINGEVYCDVKGVQIKFSFRQAFKRVENKTDSYRTFDLEETGTIILKMYERSYDRKEWKDTSQVSLEDKILHSIAYVELYAEKELLEKAERERQWKIKDDENARLEELKKLKIIESQKIEELIESASQFEKSQKITHYLDKRKEFLLEQNCFTHEEEEYYNWGMQISSELNPLKNS